MDNRSASLDLPALLADALAASVLPVADDGHPDNGHEDNRDQGDVSRIDLPLIAQIVNDLRGVSCRQGAPVQGDPPDAVTRYLPSLAAAMSSTPIAEAVRPYLNEVSWYQIFDGARVPEGLASGLMAGQIIGGRGLLASDDLYFGLFLLAPHLTYPLHQHAALEIYCVLSGEVQIRHGRMKEARRIKAGGHSVTPPHQVHELRTEDQACLIAYAWTGDLTGENWWWEEGQNGQWDRVCWRRQPDSSWKVTHREPLSEAEVSRAGDR